MNEYVKNTWEDTAKRLGQAAEILVSRDSIEKAFAILTRMRAPKSITEFIGSLMDAAKDAGQAKRVSRVFQESLTDKLSGADLGRLFYKELEMHVRTGNKPGFRSCLLRAGRAIQKNKLDESFFPHPPPSLPDPSLS